MNMTGSNKLPADTQRKKPTLVIAAAIISVMLLGFAAFNIHGQLNQPSLGSQLEYIGQRQFGCLLVVLCESSSPSSDYYFATDMTEDQLKIYFKNARYVDVPNSGGVLARIIPLIH
jgi:hypothetical protein